MEVSLNELPGLLLRFEREASSTPLTDVIEASSSFPWVGWGAAALWVSKDGDPDGHRYELNPEARALFYSDSSPSPGVARCGLQHWLASLPIAQEETLRELTLHAEEARLPTTIEGELLVRGGDAGEGDWRVSTQTSEGVTWAVGIPHSIAPVRLRAGLSYGWLVLEARLLWSPWSGRRNRASQPHEIDARDDVQATRDALASAGWKLVEASPP